MADKEEITLDAYAKKFKKDDNKGGKMNGFGKKRIVKKFNGGKFGKGGALRKTGRSDRDFSGGKPR